MRDLQRKSILGLAVLAAVVGCKSSPFAFGQPKSRSAFDRDPLVMAHLTHSKDDPAYRDTETDLAKIDEPQLQPASSHSKSNKPPIAETTPGYDAPARSRAPDYRWIRGVAHSARTEAGQLAWYVDYSRTSKDKFGGRLRLSPSPRLGLLREGDPVHLTGRVVADDPRDPSYEVADIILMR